MDNLEEVSKFLENYNLPKLNQEEIENLNRPIISTEIKTVIKKKKNHFKHLFLSQCGKIRCQLQEKKTIKNTNIWRLNNTLLNNQQITEEIKICIETSENGNTTTPSLWDSVKSLLRGKFIAIKAYLKKQERNQINNLTLHLKQLEKKK